jgi:hypothetical protein
MDDLLAIGDLADASGMTVRALHHYEQIALVSASQRTEAGHRRYTLGEQGMAAAQSAWADLISELEAARAAGADPHDPAVRALAARWTELIQQFSGGDPGIAESLERMYREEGAERASRGAVSPEIMEYVRQASAG